MDLFLLRSQSILAFLSSSHVASVIGITRLSNLSSPSSALRGNTDRADNSELGVLFSHETR